MSGPSTKRVVIDDVVARGAARLAATSTRLDKALSLAHEADERLFVAKRSYRNAVVAMDRVRDFLGDGTRTAEARLALTELMTGIESDLVDIKGMKSRIATYTQAQTGTINRFDEYAMARAEEVLGGLMTATGAERPNIIHAPFTPVFTATKQAEAPAECTGVITDPGEAEGDMSVETIVHTTLGPIESAVALLKYAVASAAVAAKNLDGEDSAGILLAKATEECKAVKVDGKGETTEAKETLERISSEMSLDSVRAAALAKRVDEVRTTVGLVVKSIYEFVGGVRSAIFLQEPEQRTPPPEDVRTPGPERDAAPGREMGDSASTTGRVGEAEQAVTSCITQVARGNISAANTLLEQKPELADAVFNALDGLAGSTQEAEATSAVDALATIMRENKQPGLPGRATEIIHGIEGAPSGVLDSVRAHAGDVLSEIGAAE